MTGEHKAALATAGFLVALGACSILSLPRGEAPADAGAPVGRDLIIPVAGVAFAALADSFGAARDGGRRHEGVDIMVALGTPVRAAASGTILKLHTSERGGRMLYQADESGRIILCYGHLNAYAEGVREGMRVAQGQTIAAVGQSGNATMPHLHFEVLTAKAPGQWWGGEAVNPYLALKAGRVETAVRASAGDSGR